MRNYPDLLAAFKDPSNTIPNIVDWGQRHWDYHGSPEGRNLPTIKQTNPNISMGDTIDLGPSATKIGTSGIPMPDVEGYKYVYNAYDWNRNSNAYEPIAAKYHNIDEYPYYPYMPQGGEAANRNGRILVGISIVPDDYHTYPD